jgi:hypothetical protein
VRLRSAPEAFRLFSRAVIKTVGWEKKTTGIEIRFVEKPGFTDHGPAMVGGVVYMMRPIWWEDMGAHSLARTLLHEIQHVFDYRDGSFFDMTRDEAEKRAQRAEVRISSEQASALAESCGLEIEFRG